MLELLCCFAAVKAAALIAIVGCLVLGFIVIPDTASEILLADLANASTHAGHLSGTLHVHLYATPTALSRAMVIGAFTEATFTGYAAATVTAPTAFVDPTLGAYLLWTVCNFTVGATPTVTNTIYGYYVVDGTGNLLWAEALPNPVTMTVAGNNIAIVPVFGGVSQNG